MPNMRQYWADVRRKEQELTQGDPITREVTLTSLPNRELMTEGGATHVVPIKAASEMIINGSHRLATDEEIAVYKEANRLAALAGKAHSRKMSVINGGHPYGQTLQMGSGDE